MTEPLRERICRECGQPRESAVMAICDQCWRKDANRAHREAQKNRTACLKYHADSIQRSRGQSSWCPICLEVR
jgi:NMD protein affecting ribosome stability and mRNA decay